MFSRHQAIGKISQVTDVDLFYLGSRVLLAAMSCSDVISSILDQTSTGKFFIEIDGFLTNHVSYGIIALHRLGAQPERIKRFVDWYTPKLESAETDVGDDRSSEQQKGQRVAFYKIAKEYEKTIQTTR
ncbi:hypothetical protein MAR_012547 [Mya arenaria]|uniref:Uncharacterized protein n=1 Tax=Mya arenaria TaxID=6604 RepID=A0ABY7G135_MYAAR|nr:hypothetical protein MAR_012547 [Mya arenaria]